MDSNTETFKEAVDRLAVLMAVVDLAVACETNQCHDAPYLPTSGRSPYTLYFRVRVYPKDHHIIISHEAR